MKIAYHKSRESTAVDILHPIKILGTNNFAYVLNKTVTSKTFLKLYGELTQD